MIAWLFILLGLCLALGAAIPFAMGLASAAFLLLKAAMGVSIPLVVIPQRVVNGVDVFPFLAVPFFILAGELMNAGGITTRIVAFCMGLVGHITGGMAHVVVATNVIMAGISGSAAADASATGSILIPAMERAGYGRGFAAALVAAASVIGPVIPPSVGMILYAMIANVSVGRLFLGGVIPGLIMASVLMLAVYVVCRRRGYPKEPRVPLLALSRTFVMALPALLMPVIVLGGIVSGIVTPTEAAVLAVVYALVVGLWIHRELTFGRLFDLLFRAARSTAVIMLVVGFATVISWLAAEGQMGAASVWLFTELTSNPLVVLLIINVTLLVMGILLDAVEMILIMAPVLLPVINAFNLDPIHFGVLFVINVEMGLMTPPAGICLYIVCAIGRVSMAELTREIVPFIVVLLAMLAIVTYVPATVLWLPNLVLGPP